MGKSPRSEQPFANPLIGNELLANFLEVSIDLAATGKSLGALESAVVESIARAGASNTVGMIQGIKGHWRTLACTRAIERPPVDLLAEALDSEQPVSDETWHAVPLNRPSSLRTELAGRLLLIERPHRFSESDFAAIANSVSLAMQTFSLTCSQSRRAERLEALLRLTSDWNQTRQTDQLLLQMAEASTELLGAERASIFLPDSKSGQLVGRPALGVEGGEIRIAMDAGVVGQVIKTGEPQRVDHDIAHEQAQIHREIDDQLNFATRSLICVPMIDPAGKVMGAFELINKLEGHFTDDDVEDLTELAGLAAIAINASQRVEKLISSQRQVADQAAGQVQLIGQCQPIQQLRSTVERVAATDLVVLITGENGTGKEVVAQMIHYLSDRRDQVLVAVNCAAITESLLESELFGHEKGAFTDAHESRAGKFELADGGTLFLDEIGDMTLGGQAKLLRVLEEKIVVRVGGSNPIPTNARVIAATNQNLADLVSTKKFREDLFFRLNVLTIELPPLRKRGDDIILLAEHFLGQLCAKARRPVIQLNRSAQKRLLAHGWPGNVRELRNMMERLAYLSPTDIVGAEDLEFILSPQKSNETLLDADLSLADATKVFQCQYIRQHIQRAGGNMTDTAGRLGLHRSNLYRKMRQLDMDESE